MATQMLLVAENQKRCPRCETVKERSDFGRNRSKKDGLQAHCKPCQVASVLASRSKNPEKFEAYQRTYVAENREACLDRTKRWFARNPTYHKEWNAKNPGRACAGTRKWQAKNMDRVIAANAKYRASLAAQSILLTPEQKAEIVAFYAEARRIGEETGVPHHVDHIVPLNGQFVKGLHVPWNLQVIPAAENIAKSNKLLRAA